MLRYALQVLEPVWITSRQIEAGACHQDVQGKIWVPIGFRTRFSGIVGAAVVTLWDNT